MDLYEKIRTLPASPGVYLYKNAEGGVIYVGKDKSLRARVRSYFLDSAAEDAKTGSLLREAVDVEYIVVDNEKEALALENKSRDLTQAEAGKILGIQRPHVSALMRNRSGIFPVGRLMGFLTAFGQDVEISVKPARGKHGEVFVVA